MFLTLFAETSALLTWEPTQQIRRSAYMAQDKTAVQHKVESYRACPYAQRAQSILYSHTLQVRGKMVAVTFDFRMRFDTPFASFD